MPENNNPTLGVVVDAETGRQPSDTADGYLKTRIDFDGNGVFDAGEQIVTGTLIPSCTLRTLSFTVPNVPLGPTTYSGFRFSSQTGLAPTGLTTDG